MRMLDSQFARDSMLELDPHVVIMRHITQCTEMMYQDRTIDVAYCASTSVAYK